MVFAINPPSLNQPGRKTPVQFVIGGPSYDTLRDWSQIILEGAGENPQLLSPQSDFKETKPELKVEIHRNRAADLGVASRAEPTGHGLSERRRRELRRLKRRGVPVSKRVQEVSSALRPQRTHPIMPRLEPVSMADCGDDAIRPGLHA